jgi:hypothetical protein
VTTPTTYTDLCAQGEAAMEGTTEAKRAKVEAELDLMKTAGIIEVAVRNPSVADYMQHWEARAEAAEATVATLTAQVEAMRPLVAQLAAMPIGPATADDVPLYGLDCVYITHGHVRAARAALTTENQTNG